MNYPFVCAGYCVVVCPCQTDVDRKLELFEEILICEILMCMLLMRSCLWLQKRWRGPRCLSVLSTIQRVSLFLILFSDPVVDIHGFT